MSSRATVTVELESNGDCATLVLELELDCATLVLELHCATLVLELQKLLAFLRPTSLPTAPGRLVLEAHKLLVQADKLARWPVAPGPLQYNAKEIGKKEGLVESRTAGQELNKRRP